VHPGKWRWRQASKCCGGVFVACKRGIKENVDLFVLQSLLFAKFTELFSLESLIRTPLVPELTTLVLLPPLVLSAWTFSCLVLLSSFELAHCRG